MPIQFSFEVKVTKGQLKDMPTKIRDKVLPTSIHRLANIAYYEMMARSPVRTGVFRSSIRQKITKSNFVVGPTAEYTPFVILPTRAHIIRPREKAVLHWVTDEGEDVFAMRVFHPGTRGNTFLETVANSVNSQVVDVFERVYNEEMERY